ncbi:MAG: class II glutamine amidotransferase [Candidatus Omnitrophica bacterium]|nr:class II glutamine amidotransferase [Candidatus Omnitrophota bacterium]
MKTRFIALLFFFVLIGRSSEACRFWVAVGSDNDYQYVVDQLIREPNSLKNLGETYRNGWSVGFYDHGDEIVIRGQGASKDDPKFDDAVRYVAVLKPEIIMAHLRRASSGCVEGVADPHPFRITYNNKTWLFGHNGDIKKEVLIRLIGEGFLKAHPPSVCNDHPPESWIDSELYFMLIMKTIKEYDDNVEKGIVEALKKVYAVIPEQDRYLNFFMSDGKTVWVMRKGNTLFYRFDHKKRMTVLASSIPNSDEKDWSEFPEDTLAVVEPQTFPKFISIK